MEGPMQLGRPIQVPSDESRSQCTFFGRNLRDVFFKNEKIRAFLPLTKLCLGKKKVSIWVEVSSAFVWFLTKFFLSNLYSNTYFFPNDSLNLGQSFVIGEHFDSGKKKCLINCSFFFCISILTLLTFVRWLDFELFLIFCSCVWFLICRFLVFNFFY